MAGRVTSSVDVVHDRTVDVCVLPSQLLKLGMLRRPIESKLASFGSVDLRTVNHNSTFYVVELFAFVNVFSTMCFFYLNRKRSPYRYLIVVLGCGEPIAATFIFSFAEVFGGFENMTGGVANTLLALLWTQYQYFIFPMIFGYMGFRLLREDWRHAWGGEDALSEA